MFYGGGRSGRFVDHHLFCIYPPTLPHIHSVYVHTPCNGGTLNIFGKRQGEDKKLKMGKGEGGLEAGYISGGTLPV